jgi:dihydrodipicolinate synthase/N-acetylneuraminate lyase
MGLNVPNLRRLLHGGLVIPAHPLALTALRKLDERRQAALTRYYCDAGAGGIAVGVHTTQFAIRDAQHGLLEPVLSLAAEEAARFDVNGRRVVKIAGICGATKQAQKEAALACDLGYDAGLLSLGAMRDASVRDLIQHCKEIARVIPLFGFYLQPAVGGRVLDYTFWREFAEIENLVAIKAAPFNRHQTIEVLRAVADSGRQHEIALYTGNDDNIVNDLMSEFRLGAATLHFAGGLLGQWAVWTRRAVELLDRVKACRSGNSSEWREVLARGAEVTDSNAALFDARNHFRGCIAGLHEVLRRQGLVAGRWLLDPDEDLSPGQMEEMERVCRCYPDLTDDSFVAENLHRWLS